MSLHREFVIATLAATVMTVACASKPPRPIGELARAQTLVDQAEQAGAQQYSAAELSTARQKIQSADDAADKGRTEAALRLANEAALDAQLAMARTSAGKAQAAAGEVSQSVETLRREAARDTSGTP